MIKYDYEITVNGNQAKLNKDIYLFRGNKNVHYYFAVKNASFNFKGSTDLIEKTNAINAAVTVIKPNNVEVASAIAKVENGKIHLKVTEDLIDEEVEVGDFDLVFDLFDDTDGAVTIPKVIGQFHVLERPCTTPISELVATNTTNEVDQALTDYAIVTYAEPVASTNADGTFAKKTWVAKEKITTAELNRMEEGISDVSSQCKDIAKQTITNEERTKLINLKNYDDTSVKNDIQTQKARIDTFTSLTDGSTTGDAELIDSRIGADGITYANLGDAIRGQLSKINKIIDILPMKVLIPNTREEINTQLGSCDTSGKITLGSVVRRVTDYLDLYKYGTFYFSDDCVNERSYWLRLFDKNKNFIASYNTSATNAKVTSQDILDSYPLAKYGVFSIKCTNPNDGSLETRSTIFYSDSYSINKTESLNNVYKKIDFNGALTKEIQLEIGGMDRTTGNIVMSGFTTNLRTPFFIKVIGNTELKISFNDKNVDIIEYDKNLNYIKYTDTNNKIMLNKNTKYIKIHHYNKDGINYEKNITITLNSDEEFNIMVKNNKTSDTEEFAYKLNGEDYYTNGKLKLPPNYDVFGKAVPLIVFVHGSSDFYGLESLKMTTNYEKYYNYLRDCGYAIFDCYGWGNKYSDLITGTSTWGTPTNMNSYLSGIAYVLSRFNIDRNNIFVTGKSLGGIQAFALCYQKQIKINACGLLAPALNPLHQNFGYTKTERITIAKDFGFLEDINHVLNTDNFVENDNYIAYIKENSEKMSGWNPYWSCMLLDNNAKVSNSIKYKDENVDYSNVYKICEVPFKIWVADDDINISPKAIKNVVKMLNNSGCIAEARIMPNNTGAHHAVDNDANAMQTINVTTKLGIHYDTIPTAYYELSKYFDRYLI